MLTPGVAEDRTADTLDALAAPIFRIAILSWSHSLESIVPFPFPPDTATDTKSRSGTGVRLKFRVVVPPADTMTPEAVADWYPTADAVTVYVSGASGVIE